MGKLDPRVTQCGLAEAYLRTRWHLDPSSRLATTDMGRKLGVGALPFEVMEWSWVRVKHSVARAETYLRSKWHLDPSSRLGTINMGRKVGSCAPF